MVSLASFCSELSILSDVDAQRLRELSSDGSDAARGCLDEFGLLTRGEPASAWHIRGWAVFRDDWSAFARTTAVLLGERACYEAPIEQENRVDVARAFARPSFQYGGFKACIPVEPVLDGTYLLGIRLRHESREALFSTGRELHVESGRAYLPELHERSLLHVVHVPKTAGTSFGRLLKHAFGPALAEGYQADVVIEPRTRCIQGHTGAAALLSALPRVQLAMWFRDPVERVVSEYFHGLRHPAHAHSRAGADLLTYALRRDVVNLHRRTLDGLPLSRLDYVGITERFGPSVELFCRIFGVSLADLPPENINPDKNVGDRYDLPADLREKIAAANEADILLYQRAEQRFFELCSQHGVQVA